MAHQVIDVVTPYIATPGAVNPELLGAMRGSVTTAVDEAAATALAQIPGQVAQVVPGQVAEALSEDPGIREAMVDQIGALTADDLGVVRGEVNDDVFRVRDQAHHEAFRVGLDGVTAAHDIRVRRVSSDDPDPAWTIRDQAGHVALRVEGDGTVFIADPTFGRPLSPWLAPEVSRVVLVVQLGQSNAEGRGRPVGPRLDRGHERLLMWDWGAGALATATVPLSSQQSRIGLSPATVIGRAMVDASGQDTAVVVLNAAAGGSGLVVDPEQGCWAVGYTGPNPPLLTIALDALDATVDAVQERFPLAQVEPWVYWHQGEADSTAGITQETYAAALDQVVAAIRDHLGDQTVPFTAGGLAPEHNARKPPDVRLALMGVQARLEYAAYTDGVANGSGSSSPTDLAHYTRDGIERLGRRMHTASLRAATATVTQVPHAPSVVHAHLVGDVLHVDWSEPGTRWTGFDVQYRIDGGAWVTAPRTTPLDTQEAVAGVTGTLVEVQVAAVNATMTSPYTTPVYAHR